MQEFKKEFIEFMVRSGVLTFGDFTTKSGRKTPFFINTGNYDSGAKIERLGLFYAQALQSEIGLDIDVLYGPAYKGIPLAVTTAAAISKLYGKDLGFSFNRKEAKDHGEGGLIVGRKLKDGDKVVIVEDVITAGTAIRENLPVLQGAAKVNIQAVIVSVDRMERGTGPLSAIQQVEKDYGIRTFAIVTIEEVVAHLLNRPVDGKVVLDDAMKKRIDAYRAEYGV
ncbi:MAG: orotate phosphoribosyltransferase [Verrucomicrobiota bacterium]|jgi:orotate phosphoribosyltransferase